MATRKELLEIGGREVSVSNPDKVYFPRAGHTKIDLVRYFLAVADGALTGVRGRPMALKRFVDGAEKEPFFQKRAPDNTPDWIRTATLTFPSGRTADEIVVDEAAALAWVANLGCLDLNPHPVRAEDLDHPDELRVDLDPVPGVPLVAGPRGGARRAASRWRPSASPAGPRRRARAGIHINVRIEPPLDVSRRSAARRWPWPATSSSGRRRSRPAKWWKEERHGVFLDYNQNAKDRTVASAYSVRPTPDARVSFPLRWDEVPDVVMEDFTLATVPAIYAERGDAGAGIDDAVGSLEALLELSARHEAEGEGDAPWPPNYAKQEGEPPRVQPSKHAAQARRVRGSRQGRRPAARGRRGACGRRRGRRPERRAADGVAGLAAVARRAAASRASPSSSSGGRRSKAEVYEGLERWKARHPEAAAHLEPADVIETAMRGRAYAWYRLRLNLIHVPEELRPPQEPLDPDAAPDDWANLSDDERAAWMAGRRPSRKAAPEEDAGLSGPPPMRGS